jgi:tRNA pseudouridine32 synthase / 23S rRNA pseudouridine746 synthase
MVAAITTEFHTIPVLFENDDIIAVDKPEKLASIPERNPEKISLLKILSDTLQRKFFVVHRLDKQVSGVIVFAKNAETHRHLNLLFEQRKVHKTYMALVHGTIEGDGGLIETPLRRFGSGRTGEDRERGKPCRTEFSVLERMPGYTMVRVDPLTGRKHQIRAHLFGIGHPIVGDPLYGDKALQKTFPRLMLHALSIRLLLAAEGQDVAITSEIPISFSDLLCSLRHPSR